jgi:hypothetical protein
MSRCSFTANETQRVKIKFKLKEAYNYNAEDYDDDLSFDIAKAFIDNCDGEVDDWEIWEDDLDVDSLQANKEYCIEIEAKVKVGGTCYFSPGRYDGPMEDCYPDEIDDVEYEEGVIGDCNWDLFEEELPYLTFSEMGAVYDDVSGDAEINLSDY